MPSLDNCFGTSRTKVTFDLPERRVFSLLVFPRKIYSSRRPKKKADRKDNTCLVIIYDSVFLHYAKKHFKNRKRPIPETSERYIFR